MYKKTLIALTIISNTVQQNYAACYNCIDQEEAIFCTCNCLQESAYNCTSKKKRQRLSLYDVETSR